ncbi:MAG TPA: hypothetical protein VFM50_14755 [Nocardioidaceae bacterium]|jgi:hypothetical protein|nr:hypothetical protein [Nocardioidaceae bacterium]
MATLSARNGTLAVRFTRVEKVFGLLRDHDYPLSAVLSVATEPDGLGAVRGIRAPGLGLPGVARIGTFYSSDGKTLASVTRDRGAVIVRLVGEKFDRLVIGADDPRGCARELNAARR